MLGPLCQVGEGQGLRNSLWDWHVGAGGMNPDSNICAERGKRVLASPSGALNFLCRGLIWGWGSRSRGWR